MLYTDHDNLTDFKIHTQLKRAKNLNLLKKNYDFGSYPWPEDNNLDSSLIVEKYGSERFQHSSSNNEFPVSLKEAIESKNAITQTVGNVEKKLGVFTRDNNPHGLEAGGQNLAGCINAIKKRSWNKKL